MNWTFYRAFVGKGLTAAVLFGIHSDSSAQPTNLLFSAEPDWIRSIEWSAPSQPTPGEKAEGTRYLLYERQEHPQRREKFTRLIVLMENQTGVQDSGNLSFNLDPAYEQLILHRVQIHRGGGMLDRLDKSKVRVIQPERELEEHLITGKQTAVLFVEDLRIGDALEYSYTTRGSNPVIGDHYSTRLTVQSSVPVDRQRMRVVWLSDKTLHMRTHLSDTAARQSPWNGGTDYTWDFTNLTAIEYEDYLPHSYEPYPYIELSDFDTWARVVDWALPLYMTENTNLAPEMQDLISQWQNRAGSSEERARLALEFVQDELRYTALELGPDSYRPTPAAETFQKRFGDCKGKVTLLFTLLRAMNIEAYPALVNSSVREAISRRLPSPFAFDHVIVKAILEGKTVWLDSTISHQGGSLWERQLPAFGKALVVQRGVTSLEDISPPRMSRARQKVTSTITMKDYKSPATFTVKTIHYDSGADNMREQIARTPKELSKRYLNFYARYYPAVETTLPLEFSDDRKNNVLTMTEHYRIQDLWKLDKSNHRWEAEFYAESLYDVLTEPATRFRKMPLRLPFPRRFEQEIVVHLPERDWNIPAAENAVEHDAFKFHYRRQFSNSTVRFQYECETKASELPPEKATTYLAKLDEMQNLLGDTLQRPDNETRGILERINWLMAVVALFCMTAALVGSVWIWRATRPPTDMPPLLPAHPQLQGIGGWLLLIAFGLCVSPFIRIVSIAQSWEGYFSLDVWQNVALTQGDQYHPLYAPLLIFEVLGNSLLLGLNILVACLFFAKRRVFPQLFIVLLISNAVFLLLDEVLGNQIPFVATDSGASSFRTVFRAALPALIWSAYMVKSKRVKATFIR